MSDKFEKAEVDYSDGHKDGDHCGICEHFLRRGRSCTLVKGVIEPLKWCNKFKKRSFAARMYGKAA